MCLSSPFRPRVGDRPGPPRPFQDAQVNDIISHIADFFPPEAGLRQEAFHDGDFTALLLPKEIYFKLPRTPRGGGRWPTGDPARFETRAAQPHQAQTVPDVESLNFLLTTDQHGPVGEDTVHIAQEQPDALERRRSEERRVGKERASRRSQ